MARQGYVFTDIVTGRGVYHYLDKLGREWLAEGAWSLFRVRKEARDAS